MGHTVFRCGTSCQGVKCDFNPGVLDLEGKQVVQPARIWVDDALMAAVGLVQMKMVLAAIIEAIFTVMGTPDTSVRQCPLAMDKWIALVVGESQLALGLTLNTRSLSVAITPTYLAETLNFIQTTWHQRRKRFSASEASKLVGKLGRLAEGAPWVRYLVSFLYTSIALALAQNREFLMSSSKEFKKLIAQIKSKNFAYKTKKNHQKVILFALKKVARQVHRSKLEHNILPSMREEINFFERALKRGTGVSWESPIAFLIKKTPVSTTFGDACLDAGGGYSLKMKFWWHIQFPDEIVQRTLKHLSNNESNNFISINVLEFLVVIINYCAALTVVTTERFTDDPHPVLLNIVDNTSAHSWTTHTCKASHLGKLLAKFLCYLLMDAILGINSSWISTTDNYIADDISRIKKLDATSSQQFVFDYSSLPQKYPQLRNFRFFQPSQELLSMLWGILLHKKLPSLKQVRTLKQSGLGKLIS